MINKHEKVEKSVGLFFIFTIFAISIGGLVEITPLFFQKATTTPVDNLRPYTALEMEGSVLSVRKQSAMVITQLLVKAYGNIHIYGVQNVQGQI